MNALRRFIALGMDDADRRVSAWRAAPSFDGADAYLKNSAIIRTIDRATVRLSEWWRSSASRKVMAGLIDPLIHGSRASRHREISAIVLIATIVHVALTLESGARPGWFWIVVPALAVLFAVLSFAAAREPQLPH